MKPYYDHAGIQIYLGDCRQIVPALAERFDVILTDPVWPGTKAHLIGAGDPLRLWSEAAALFRAALSPTGRLCVQLGCDTDPRFLMGVPPSLPFLCACWLEYAKPHCKGRILYGSDVAYVFGLPPASIPGRRLCPNRFVSGRVDADLRGQAPGPVPFESKQFTRKGRERAHPCPRRLEHVAWLVRWFADGAVLDPFMGSGTTLLAAKNAGFPCVGVEIEERFCELAARRLSQDVFAWPEAEPCPSRA